MGIGIDCVLVLDRIEEDAVPAGTLLDKVLQLGFGQPVGPPGSPELEELPYGGVATGSVDSDIVTIGRVVTVTVETGVAVK